MSGDSMQVDGEMKHALHELLKTLASTSDGEHPIWCEPEYALSSIFGGFIHLPCYGAAPLDAFWPMLKNFVDELPMASDATHARAPPGAGSFELLWPDAPQAGGERLSTVLRILSSDQPLAPIRVTWFPKHGCALVALGTWPERSSSALKGESPWHSLGMLNLILLGLDNWVCHVHRSSGGHAQQTTDCQGHKLLDCGRMSIDDYDSFKGVLSARMAQEKNTKKEEKGVEKKHWTPGYIQACVIDALGHVEVLRDSDGSAAEECPLSDPCGGFTDVGTHTGCLPRDTTWPLVRETLQFLLIQSAGPEGEETMRQFFRLALLHFELWLLMRQAALVNTTSATPKMVDACMVMLASISKKAAVLSDDGGDVSSVEACLEVARSHLFAEQGNRAVAAGQRFQISGHEGSVRLPHGALPSAMGAVAVEDGLGAAKLRSLKNLGSLSVLPERVTVEALLAWVKLSQWTENRGGNAVAGQLVLRGVEAQMFRWARSGFHGLGYIQLAVPTLLEVLEAYRGHVSKFMASPACEATMLVELRSREVLVIWVATCLIHKACCRQHPITSDYGIGLDWRALEHLVLSNRDAVDAALSVSAYVKANTQLDKSLFTLVDEGEATFEMAEEFARDDSTLGYLLEVEEDAAAARVEAHWAEVKRKQQLASSLRGQIKDAESDLSGSKARRSRAISERNSYHSFSTYSATISSIDTEISRGEALLRRLKGQLRLAEMSPPPVIQPLPQDLDLARIWLFFLYMPPHFRQLSQATFLAQQALLPYPRSSVEDETFVDAYKTHVVDHYSKNQGTYHIPTSTRKGETGRVELWTRNRAPEDVGSMHVDHLYSKSDGVWYPDSLAVEMCWSGSGSEHDRIEDLHVPLNPFANIEPEKRILSFTERLRGAAEALQWCMPTYGTVGSTDPKRGNTAIASQDLRGSLSKPCYLALGSLRSYSFGQYRRLCAALCQKSFPLDHPVVRTTVMQALYHLGQLFATAEGQVGLKWRAGWDKPGDVLTTLWLELDRLADELEQTPREHDSVLLLGTITAYLSAWHGPCILTARRFAKMVSLAADNENVNIQAAALASEDRVQQGLRERQTLLRKISLLCYASGPFNVDDKAADAAHMIELMALINHGCIFIEEQSEDSKKESTNLNVRCQNIMALAVDALMGAVQAHLGCLTAVVRLVLPRAPRKLKWLQLGTAASFQAEGADAHLYCINILDGTVLLDGSPPSRLPKDIVDDHMYRQAFS
eukprot:gene24216-9816_t